MLTLDKIYQASYVLKEVIRHTDLIYAPQINPDSQIYLKPENLQLTGSFKVRGAYYKISQLTDEEKEQRFSFEMRLSNPRTMGDTYEIIIENELSSRKKQIIFSDSNIRAISVDKTVFSTPNILDLNNFVSEVENYFGIQFNFEKIAYLSVSKGINRKQIEKWVKNKFVI